MTDACCIGFGAVGQSTAKVFGISRYISKSGGNITFQDASKCRFIFLALPTPTENGRCDTSAIEEVVKQLAGLGCSGVIVNRSTVTPGTTRNLVEKYNVAMVSNPEFLSEDTAEYDAKHPDVIVIGSDVPVWGEALKNLYDARFKGVDTFLTDSITSETIKYGVNSFYALKVVFANQLYELCKKSGANYEKIKEVMYKRKWIGDNHMTIWYKNKRGLWGKCLKKDLEEFANYSQIPLLLEANRLDEEIRYERESDN